MNLWDFGITNVTRPALSFKPIFTTFRSSHTVYWWLISPNNPMFRENWVAEHRMWRGK
jgi:hypothetical protein